MWQYHSEVLTDQSPEEVCTNIIREKLLEYLPQEVPYSITQVTNEPFLPTKSEKSADSAPLMTCTYFELVTYLKLLILTTGHLISVGHLLT